MRRLLCSWVLLLASVPATTRADEPQAATDVPAVDTEPGDPADADTEPVGRAVLRWTGVGLAALGPLLFVGGEAFANDADKAYDAYLAARDDADATARYAHVRRSSIAADGLRIAGVASLGAGLAAFVASFFWPSEVVVAPTAEPAGAVFIWRFDP